MMGTSHATSGAFGWLLAAPLAGGAIAGGFTGPELLAGAVVCAGAALLPDIDHPRATIAHTLGPITMGVAKFVNLISGGHRQGTHSILFIALSGVVTWLLASWSTVAALLIVWAMTALALKALHLAPKRMNSTLRTLVTAVEAAIITWAISRYAGESWEWLGFAVAAGVTLHIIGDMLTPEGCPLLWPAQRRFAIPVIPHTDHWLETKVFVPLMAIGTGFLIYQNVWPEIQPMLPWV